MRVSINYFSEYIFRQLKWHQHKIRSKTDISSEITVNVCKYSLPSFNKTLTLTTAPFLVPSLSANLPWCQECIFYCGPRKKRYTLPPEGTDIHIQQHNHRKDLNPCLSLIIMTRSLLNWKIHSLTKKHFEILICF